MAKINNYILHNPFEPELSQAYYYIEKNNKTSIGNTQLSKISFFCSNGKNVLRSTIGINILESLSVSDKEKWQRIDKKKKLTKREKYDIFLKYLNKNRFTDICSLLKQYPDIDTEEKKEWEQILAFRKEWKIPIEKGDGNLPKCFDRMCSNIVLQRAHNNLREWLNERGVEVQKERNTTKKEWKGTLTELADFIVEENKIKKYIDYKDACLYFCEKYTHKRENININSLHTLVRQLKSGNRSVSVKKSKK